MGRDKSKVAWGKGNARGDLCSTTSSTSAVQDLLRRDERPHQGPPKLAANVLPRERTEGHSRAYRSSQRMVKTCPAGKGWHRQTVSVFPDTGPQQFAGLNANDPAVCKRCHDPDSNRGCCGYNAEH